MISMKSFSSIGQFRHAVQYMEYNNINEMYYKGTIKLHGTNVAVALVNGKLKAYSRGGDEIDDSFFNFNEFLNEESLAFKEIFKHFSKSPDGYVPVLHGEWIGPGIQKGCAIHKLSNKMFVIFNSSFTKIKEPDDEGTIRQYLGAEHLFDPKNERIKNITDYPWYEFTLSINNLKEAKEYLDDLTLKVEEECPFGKAFGIEGIGEGLVWVPVLKDYKDITKLWFKTKGEKHGNSGAKRKNPVVLSPEELKTIEDVVRVLVPEWRLKQFMPEIIDEKETGNYIKAVNQDYIKEEGDLLKKLDSKIQNQAKREATKIIRDYFVNKMNKF